MNFVRTLPKRPGIGSVHLEFKRCGKPTCRCCRGFLHGPYAYHHFREQGRQRKSYIAMVSLTETFGAIERQKEKSPTTAEILRLLKEPSHV